MTFLLSLALFGAGAFAQCALYLTHEPRVITLWGQTIEATAVHGPGDDWPIDEIIPDLKDGDLVFAASVNLTAVFYRGMRFNAEVFLPYNVLIGNAKIRPTKLMLAKGALVHVSGLSESVRRRLDVIFAERRREMCLTCASGAAGVGRRVGLRNLGRPVTPNTLLKRLLVRKLTAGGLPIRRKLYLYNVDDLTRQRWFDRGWTLTYVVHYSIVAGVAVLMGLSLWQ